MDSPIQKGNSEIVKKNEEMISTKINSDFTKNLGLLVPQRSAAKKATTQIKKTEKVLTPKPNKTKSETNNELRAKLTLLGLSRQGNKETLLARLQEYENNKIKTEWQSPNNSTNLSNINDENVGSNEKSTVNPLVSQKFPNIFCKNAACSFQPLWFSENSIYS